MPMPKPNAGESRADFMSRCMANDVMQSEFPDTDQRAAVCATQWRDRNKDTSMSKERAYSILITKDVSEDKRIITGMASTPAPDRMGDIIEPLGVKFTNPLPLLWQHRSDHPVGTVKFRKPTKDGIEFEAQLPRVSEPASLKDRVDTAWAEIKLGLVRGVSIGFRSMEHAYMKDGGIHFIETEVLELSLVTVPANHEATIDSIKSIDTQLLAASGRAQQRIDSAPAGVTARRSTTVVKAKEAKHMAKKTVAEAISAFEATRQAKAARLDEITDASNEKGETLDAAAKEEFDAIELEIKEIDEHLKRLRTRDAINRQQAKAVDGSDPQAASNSRSGNGHDPIRVTVKANVEPGTQFARMVWCKVHGFMNMRYPADVARQQRWHDQTPEVERYLRAPVAVGTTTDSTWAGPLVEESNLVSEFAELLRPATIIGRIPGITRVPFNIKIPRETTGATVAWVGEAAVKPVGAMAFDQITMLFNKVAGIVPVSEELFRFSSPSVDAIIRNSLRDAVAYLIDRDFLDPTKTAVTGVSPASITNGVSAITATGTNADALRADLGTLLSAYATDNQNLSSLVLIMTATQAIKIGLMRNTLGQPEFSAMGRDGGSLEGIPVIVSENIVATGGSPTDGSLIVAINAREILLADDGQVNIDVSREASLQMDTSPDSPDTASTVHVSLWQRNLVALKAERFITWAKRRSTAVQYIQNAKYA